MKFQGLWENRRFLFITLSLLGFSLILVGVNLVMLGVNRTPVAVNNIANVIAILLASGFAVRVWLSNTDDQFLNMFWGLLALGLVFWAVAEILWLYFSYAEAEVPFPSWADVFWLIGYVPITGAFLWRHSRLRITQTLLQKAINFLIAASFISAAGVYVLWPTITAFDPEKFLESLLSLAYPLTDMVLIILILRLFFSTQTGRFAITWQLLGLGFLAMAISDLMFSYGDWNGIYYPDGNPNLFSIVLDVLYYNSYLLIAVGILAFGFILAMDRGIKIKSGSKSLTKSSILLFVDRYYQVMSFSDNLLGLINRPAPEKHIKWSLTEALGIDTAVQEDIRTNVLLHGAVSNRALTVRGGDGSRRDAWLTAVAINDYKNELTNIAIVLRTNLEDKAGQSGGLTPEQEGLIDYYLNIAGTRTREEREILQDYYKEQIRLLYSIIRQFGGIHQADGMALHLNRIANNDGWRVSHEGQEIKIPEEYDVRVLAEALSTLLRAARWYAVEATSSTIVDEEMRKLDQGIKPDALHLIDQFNLRTAQTAI